MKRRGAAVFSKPEEEMNKLKKGNPETVKASKNVNVTLINNQMVTPEKLNTTSVLDDTPVRITRSSSRIKSAVTVAPVKKLPEPEQGSDSDDLLSIHNSESEPSSESDSDFEDTGKGKKKFNRNNKKKNNVQTTKKKTNGTAAGSKSFSKETVTPQKPRIIKSTPKKKVTKNTKPKTALKLSSGESSSEDSSEDEATPSRFASTKNRPGLLNSYNNYKAKECILPNKHLERLDDSSESDDDDSNSKSSAIPVAENSKLPSLEKESVPNQSINKNSKKDKNKTEKSLSVLEVLAIGEKMYSSKSPQRNNKNVDLEDSDDNSSSDDWEEVVGSTGSPEKVNQGSSTIPSEGVIITIANEGNVFNKRNKKKKDMDDYLRLHLNRKIKELQVDLHKVHLLCLLARGVMMNKWLLSEELLATALSVVPSSMLPVPKFTNVIYLQKLMTWFRRIYVINCEMSETEGEFEENLKNQLVSRNHITWDSQVFIFIVILRSLGQDVRLMWSLQPLPLKPHASELIPVKKEESKEKEESDTSPSQKKKKKNQKKPEKKKTKSNTNSDEKLGRKIISSDEDEEIQKPTTKIIYGQDLWLEVYLKEEERWVCVAIQSGKFFCETDIEAKATKPMRYVLGFDNEGRVKDLTRRYADGWLTATKKLRVDSEWWTDTLEPFEGEGTERDAEEDDFLDQQLMTKSIPKTLQEFKGHPLYALRCHLLKYEAIYPPEPPSVGFFKKEPVYSRDCVKIVHTREMWVKEAKVVRIGETPYKFVKARPKFDRLSRRMITDDKPMELFGEWQTDDYIPPIAQDGKVPRSAYGNVELFKECMLPSGTVHLRLPGLNRVAKKLNIDCAPAITGFEFNPTGWGNHPVFDGFVICEEFKEIMLDAWNQDQDEQKKKQEDKRLNRIYGNWRKLVRGLMIREKLEKKYSHSFAGKRKLDETPSTSAAAAKKLKKK